MKLDSHNAYQVLEQRMIPDLNSEGAILVHKKSGAKIVLLSNDDPNKVFYIGFNKRRHYFARVHFFVKFYGFCAFARNAYDCRGKDKYHCRQYQYYFLFHLLSPLS